MDRERETRAVRIQLAQAEADLESQLDTMAGLALGVGIRGGQAPRNVAGGADHQEGGGGVGGGGEGGVQEAEVFLGGGGRGVGMVALQVRGVGASLEDVVW